MTALFAAAFRRACAGPGCPFCALVRDDVLRYLGRLLDEYALAPDIHRRLSLSRGLCAPHADLLREAVRAGQPDGMGVATLYRSVARSLADDLDASLADRRSGRRGAWAAAARERLRAAGRCLACVHADESLAFACEQWGGHLAQAPPDDPLRAAYREGAGACVPHLRALLAQTRGDAEARWLVETQREQARRLAAELEAYVLARGIGRRGEASEAAEDVWELALDLLPGDGGQR